MTQCLVDMLYQLYRVMIHQCCDYSLFCCHQVTKNPVNTSLRREKKYLEQSPKLVKVKMLC